MLLSRRRAQDHRQRVGCRLRTVRALLRVRLIARKGNDMTSVNHAPWMTVRSFMIAKYLAQGTVKTDCGVRVPVASIDPNATLTCPACIAAKERLDAACAQLGISD